jgi:hypothetical protein
MTTEFGPDIQAETEDRSQAKMTDALREGAAAGAQAAADIWPALGEVVSRTVYGTCYYAAYGATFGALTLASMVPRGTLMEKGLHDGSEAAREAFEGRERVVYPADEGTATTASPG